MNDRLQIAAMFAQQMMAATPWQTCYTVESMEHERKWIVDHSLALADDLIKACGPDDHPKLTIEEAAKHLAEQLMRQPVNVQEFTTESTLTALGIPPKAVGSEGDPH